MSNREIPLMADASRAVLSTIELEGAELSPTEAPVRVLIADERGRVRFALRTLLRNMHRLEIVGEVGDARSVAEMAQSSCCDLVLIDWGLLGGRSGFSIGELRQRCPEAQVIVLSGRPEDEASARSAGADAFVNKTESAAALLAAIDQCCHLDRTETEDLAAKTEGEM